MMSDSDLIENANIDLTRMPKHVAIIMDGNGRWAKKRLMPRQFGHKQGQKQLKKTLINCKKLGIPILSVYVFSTENWKRPESEVSFLLQFLKKTIQDEIQELEKEGVRLRFLGDLSAFGEDILQDIHDAQERTKDASDIQLNIMLNYGGRAEIIHALQSYVASGEDVRQLTEDRLQPYLYTGELPDPDILIRTGGDVRISNFMLWQLAYSELFFTVVFWPDFGLSELITVVEAFQHRDRRYGGLNE